LSGLAAGTINANCTPKANSKNIKECFGPSLSYKGAALYKIRAKMGEGAIG